MKVKKNLLLTFDYELFLGAKSGTPANCLLKPTQHLLHIFDKLQIKHAIFFVDTTYLLKLTDQRNEASKKDLALIKDQLMTLIKKGHYIFPHIHPHWLDSVYNPSDNQWSLNDYSKYRFHSISDAERENLFSKSIKLLQEIINPVDPGYEINSYRAGGWSIQPFTDFKPLFQKYGIQNDFSVLKHFKNSSNAQFFDFTNCSSSNVYKFEEDPCVSTKNGNYTEYSISSINYTNGFFSKLYDKYLWKTGRRSMGDGLSLTTEAAMETNNREMVSVELLTKPKLNHYKIFLKNNNYMHFISHPKMLSEHNLSCFEKFLSFAKNEYELQTNFINIEN